MTWDGQNETSGTIRVWDGEKYVEVPEPVGLPANGSLTQYAAVGLGPTTQPEVIGMSRQVTSAGGSSLFVPADPSNRIWKGSNPPSGTLERGIAYSPDGGQTWENTTLGPAGAAAGTVYVLTDQGSGKTWAFTAADSDQLLVAYEVLSFSPLAYGPAVPIVDGSLNPIYVLRDIVVDGSVWWLSCQTGTSGGQWGLLEWDPATGTTLNYTDVTSSSNGLNSGFVDNSTAKYGDGSGRLVFYTDGPGWFRIRKSPFTFEHQYSSPNNLGSYYSLPSFDEANNKVYIAGYDWPGIGDYTLAVYTVEPWISTNPPLYVASAGLPTYTPGSPGAQRPWSVLHDPATGKIVVIYTDFTSYPEKGGAGYLATFAFYEDTGSALNLLSSTALKGYTNEPWLNQTGSQRVSKFTLGTPSLINGKGYVPLTGNVHNGSTYYDTLEEYFMFAEIDFSTNTVSTYGADAQEEAQWRDLDSGDLSFGQNDELQVTSMQENQWSVTPANSVNARIGSVMRRLNASYFGEGFVQYLFNSDYMGSSTSFTLGPQYDGISMRKTDTTRRTILFQPRPNTSDNNVRDHHLYVAEAYGGGQNRVNQITVDATVGSMYGIRGTNGGVNSYQMHSLYEHTTWMFDADRQGYQLIGRYRPWETLQITFATTTQLYGGKMQVLVRTNSFSGTSNIRLPSIRNHGDEIVVKDVGGQASSDPINVQGFYDTIDEQSSSQDFTISDDYGYIHFRYNLERSTWIIVGRSAGGGGGFTSPADPADDGKIAVAAGGDLVYTELKNWRPNGSSRRASLQRAQYKDRVRRIHCATTSPSSKNVDALDTDGNHVFIGLSDGPGLGFGYLIKVRLDRTDEELATYDYPGPDMSPRDILYIDVNKVFACGSLGITQHSNVNLSLLATPYTATSVTRMETDGRAIFFISQGLGGVCGRLDPDTGDVSTLSIPGGGQLQDVVYDGEYFWVTDWQANDRVYQISLPTTDAPPVLVATIDVADGPRGITFDGNSVWVLHQPAGASSLTRIDPDTLTFTNIPIEYPVGATGTYFRIVFDGRYLVIPTINGSVERGAMLVDPSTGKLATRTTIDINTQNWTTSQGALKVYDEGLLLVGCGGDAGGSSNNGNVYLVNMYTSVVFSMAEVQQASRAYTYSLTDPGDPFPYPQSATSVSPLVQNYSVVVPIPETNANLNLVDLYGEANSYIIEGNVLSGQNVSLTWGTASLGVVFVDGRHTGPGTVTFQGFPIFQGNWYMFQFTRDPGGTLTGWNAAGPFPNSVRT